MSDGQNDWEQWELDLLRQYEDLLARGEHREMARIYCHERLTENAVHDGVCEIGICSYMLRVLNSGEAKDRALRWIAEEIIGRARNGEMGC